MATAWAQLLAFGKTQERQRSQRRTTNHKNKRVRVAEEVLDSVLTSHHRVRKKHKQYQEVCKKSTPAVPTVKTVQKPLVEAHGSQAVAVKRTQSTSVHTPVAVQPVRRRRQRKAFQAVASVVQEAEYSTAQPPCGSELRFVGSDQLVTELNLWVRKRATSRPDALPIYVVRGPHGCGKSTLVQHVAHKLRADVQSLHPAMCTGEEDCHTKLNQLVRVHRLKNQEGFRIVILKHWTSIKPAIRWLASYVKAYLGSHQSASAPDALYWPPSAIVVTCVQLQEGLRAPRLWASDKLCAGRVTLMHSLSVSQLKQIAAQWRTVQAAPETDATVDLDQACAASSGNAYRLWQSMRGFGDGSDHTNASNYLQLCYRVGLPLAQYMNTVAPSVQLDEARPVAVSALEKDQQNRDYLETLFEYGPQGFKRTTKPELKEASSEYYRLERLADWSDTFSGWNQLLDTSTDVETKLGLAYWAKLCLGGELSSLCTQSRFLNQVPRAELRRPFVPPLTFQRKVIDFSHGTCYRREEADFVEQLEELKASASKGRKLVLS